MDFDVLRGDALISALLTRRRRLEDRTPRDDLRAALREAGRPGFRRPVARRFAGANFRDDTFAGKRATRLPRALFTAALRTALRAALPGAAARVFAAGLFATARFATFLAPGRGVATDALTFLAASFFVGFFAGAFAAARTDFPLTDFALLYRRFIISTRVAWVRFR